MRNEYVIENVDQYKEMLKTLKDGDQITYKGYGVPAENTVTVIYMESFDGPIKQLENGTEEATTGCNG